MRETEDVIDSLVRDLKPVPRHALERRFALAILPALAVSLLLMLIVVGLRTDMAQALMLPVFWIKSAYNALLAIAAFAAVYRLSRPDGSEGRFFGIAAAIILALAVMAVIQLALSPAASYPVLVLGSSALHCPLLIFAFAMPILIANTWVLRGGARATSASQASSPALPPAHPAPGSIPGFARKTACPSSPSGIRSASS